MFYYTEKCKKCLNFIVPKETLWPVYIELKKETISIFYDLKALSALSDNLSYFLKLTSLEEKKLFFHVYPKVKLLHILVESVRKALLLKNVMPSDLFNNIFPIKRKQ